DDGVYLVLAQRALEQLLVAHVTADDLHPFQQSGAIEVALRDPVAHQADDLGLEAQQPAHDPSTHKSGAAGDQDRAVLPERTGGAQGQTFHGALPLSHSPSSMRTSRR